ncbi:hypothetical protein HID58_013682, partial [Brassica napus]
MFLRFLLKDIFSPVSFWVLVKLRKESMTEILTDTALR